jgi:elongation factor P
VSQISTAEFRRGVTIEMNDKLYAVLSYEHNKTARGSAQVRMKLRDVRSGAIIEHTVQAGTRFDRARVDRRDMQYLYSDDDFYYFMNTETYDQIPVDAAKVGDAAQFLKENDTCEVSLYGEEVIAVELPGSVALTVAATDPGVRGDTAQGGSKPATLETGLVVQVPLFISEGEVIRVNTQTGEYIERAN